MNFYHEMIAAATGCKKTDLDQIEEVMRTQHSTLDHLTQSQLFKLARESWTVVQELRRDGTFETPNDKGETL